MRWGFRASSSCQRSIQPGLIDSFLQIGRLRKGNDLISRDARAEFYIDGPQNVVAKDRQMNNLAWLLLIQARLDKTLRASIAINRGDRVTRVEALFVGRRASIDTAHHHAFALLRKIGAEKRMLICRAVLISSTRCIEFQARRIQPRIIVEFFSTSNIP